VMIEAKVFGLPASPGAEKRRVETKAILVAEQGKSSPYLDPDGVKAVLAFYASEGIEPLGSPRVTTVDGQRAVVSVSKAEVMDGKAVQTGIALDITPSVDRDLINLKLHLRIGNLSNSDDASVPDPPSNLFDTSSTFVLATNVTVPKSMTAILGKPAYGNGNRLGTNYVILVTPKLVDPGTRPIKP